ncbi:MAG: hypothetical protein KatS3mg060_3023 [Dehalococcoidia bacterium]|nr:MAG: hypothetical protein KatS3mg060_3023 [Dehalococcoidia bacterium]
MIEANEFPDLSRRYRVSAVPQTVFTSAASPEPRVLVGGGPPERFLGELFTVARVRLEDHLGDEGSAER